MSRLFTSNSKQFSWRRIAIDVVLVFLILVCLEGITRIPPIYQFLSARLDSYENLLWYSDNPTRFSYDLERDPNYTFWLLGSSYMQNGINPATIQVRVSEKVGYNITTQNFGLEALTDFKVMADLFDRWYLQIDKPEYIVLLISEGHFFERFQKRIITNGIFEQTIIFPDSLSDHVGAWIYTNSNLYRYLILARNATIVSYEKTLREPRDLGGFRKIERVFDCQTYHGRWSYVERRIIAAQANLLYFIEMTRAYDIPLLIINLPLPSCAIEEHYGNYESYQELYLHPTSEFIKAQGVPFYELDTQFNATIPWEEQYLYFHDENHSNIDGSVLFSEWTAEMIAEWLSSGVEVD